MQEKIQKQQHLVGKSGEISEYLTLHTSQVHFSVVKWAKSDVALCGGKGEKEYGRKSH